MLLGIIIGGLAVAAAVSLLIGRYYRDHFGSVTPTRDRYVRQAVAIGAWIAVGRPEQRLVCADAPRQLTA